MPEAATLFKEWSGYLKPEDVSQLETAYHFSEAAHTGQFRKSGDPYISHPLAVANILAQWHLDPQALTAALLHDVMEDTAVTKAEITRKFGKPVAELVDGVSKLDKHRVRNPRRGAGGEFPQDAAGDGARRARHPDQARRPAAQHAHAGCGRRRQAPPHRARDAGHLRADRQPARAQQHLPGTRGPLLQAPLSGPLPRAVQGGQGGARQPPRSASARCSRRSSKRLQGQQHRGRRCTGREKHLYSASTARCARSTCRSRRCSTCSASASSSRTCRRATSRWARCTASTSRSPASSRTTSRSPRPTATSRCTPRCSARSAARSKCRSARRKCTRSPRPASPRTGSTRARDAVAQRTAAEDPPVAAEPARDAVRSGDSVEFLEHLKVDLFPDEVYVFTPKGKILALPRGATAVDFAYAVHTDIGNRCVAVKINHELMPLRTELQQRRPRRDHHRLARQTQPAVAQLRRHRQGALAHPPLPENHAFRRNRCSSASACSTRRSALFKVEPRRRSRRRNGTSCCTIPAPSRARKSSPTSGSASGSPWWWRAGCCRSASAQSGETRLPGAVVIRGSEGMAVQFAQCCHPIPGDPIIGIISKGQGMVIHTHDCPLIGKTPHRPRARLLDVEWDPETKKLFDVSIKLVVGEPARRAGQSRGGNRRGRVEHRERRRSTPRTGAISTRHALHAAGVQPPASRADHARAAPHSRSHPHHPRQGLSWFKGLGAGGWVGAGAEKATLNN